MAVLVALDRWQRACVPDKAFFDATIPSTLCRSGMLSLALPRVPTASQGGGIKVKSGAPGERLVSLTCCFTGIEFFLAPRLPPAVTHGTPVSAPRKGGASFRPGLRSVGRCRNLARPRPAGGCASRARTLPLPVEHHRLAGKLPGRGGADEAGHGCVSPPRPALGPRGIDGYGESI